MRQFGATETDGLNHEFKIELECDLSRKVVYLRFLWRLALSVGVLGKRLVVSESHIKTRPFLPLWRKNANIIQRQEIRLVQNISAPIIISRKKSNLDKAEGKKYQAEVR